MRSPRRTEANDLTEPFNVIQGREDENLIHKKLMLENSAAGPRAPQLS